MSWQDKTQGIINQTRSFGTRLSGRMGPGLSNLGSRMAGMAQSSIDKRGKTFYYKLFTAIGCAWFLSDLMTLGVQGLLPKAPAVATPSSQQGGARRSNPSQFAVIRNRNLVNSKGLIPGVTKEKKPTGPQAPVKTTLPFKLVGTLILLDERKSVATISDTGERRAYPVRIGDEIPKKAKIISISARKVIFENLERNRPEFVDLPEDFKFKPSVVSAPSKTTGITKQAPNNFIISRDEVDKSLEDISKLITQVRATPVPQGFKLTQIVPNSIFDKIGLKNRDVLKFINGEKVDPLTAMNRLAELKTTNQVEVTVIRDGKEQTYIYDIQ